MCRDQTEDYTFELTQEYLAEMLGVRRSKVTVIAGTLQNPGLICYRRGAITVLDRQGLEAVACECYRIVRDGYERLLMRGRLTQVYDTAEGRLTSGRKGLGHALPVGQTPIPGEEPAKQTPLDPRPPVLSGDGHAGCVG
jgi:Crp-like helix-turn-helix domain